MLSLLRRKAQSPIIQATVVIIALVFIFWGVGTSRRDGGKPVAEVNDTPILYQDFQRAYDTTVARFREQFGGTIPAALLPQLNLEEQVLDQLINGVLLRQGAAEMGLMVSDEELQNAVREMETFRSNGVFDISRYEAILSSSRMTPATFEESMRRDLLTAKVTDYLGRFAKVPPTELDERFVFDNEKVKLAYVAFSAGDFREQVQPTDEEIAAYYEEHKDSYQTEPRIKLKYLTFQPDAAAAPEVTDAAVEEYYRNNLAAFSEPERRRARHILIETKSSDTPEELAAKRDRIAEILAKARSGEDFASLAVQYSEGPSAPQGGDLGMVAPGQMVPAFDAALFAMQEGTISDPVQTQFGFHIIKIEEIVPARTRELSEAREEIVARLRQRRETGETFARAGKAYEDIILAGSLEKYESGQGVTAKETEFFSRQTPPGDPGDPVREPAFLNAAFGLKKGELSSLVELSQGYAILYAADFQEPRTAPLEEVEERVRQDAIGKQADELARRRAEEALAAVKAAGPEPQVWNDTLTSLGLSQSETDFIIRSSGLESGTSALPAKVVSQGFTLTERSPYPDEVVAGNGTYYLFRFMEHQVPAPEEMETARADIRARRLEEKKDELFAAWLANLKDGAEITIDERFLTSGG